MATIGTKERVLCSNITEEEGKVIEKLLRKNNISYCERWKTSSGIFKIFRSGKNAKCDILVHMDSYDKAKKLVEDKDNS